MTIQSSIFGTTCIRLIASWAIIHGFLTCWDGISRWGSPFYDVVKLLVGSPYTWGVALMIGGVIAMSASLLGIAFRTKIFDIDIDYMLMKNIGLWLIAATCFLFFLGVAIASFSPHSTISLAASDRDLLICCLSIMMTKAVEPSYRKLD